MATGAATERQQEVLDLIDQGRDVLGIAQALGLTENGVRSHIKRLKQRGLLSKNWPRGGNRRGGNSRRRPAGQSNRATAVRASSNGAGPIHLDGIPALEEAVTQMGKRQSLIGEEVESIDTRVKELAEEQTTLTARRDELSVEAERLRKVEEALAGAVA